MTLEKKLLVAGIALSLALALVGAGQVEQPATPSGNQTAPIAMTPNQEATDLLAALKA